MLRIFLIMASYLLVCLHNLNNVYSQKAEMMGGITVVAPPQPIGTDAIHDVIQVNASWVALVPYGFSKKGEAKVSFNLPWQWWGEREDGITKCIQLAKDKGLKVMLKPQVYIPGGWVGDVHFDTESEWSAWEESYTNYITLYARIAQEHGVELLCIGTEYKKASVARESYWRQLISEVRKIYDGELIYSSNWDGYEAVPFWDMLDYIGVSSYFPLSDRHTPTVNHLVSKWRPIKKRLKTFSKKYDKRILFTEYGYQSVDGCAGKAWLIEKDLNNRKINQKAQANAYEALLSSFIGEDFWAGGFLWKWFPDGMGHEGYPEKDYTPQEKLSENVIKKWYQNL